MRTDTERLDWLVKMGADFCYSSSVDVTWRDEEDGANGGHFDVVRESPVKIGCRVPSRHAYRWHVFDGPTFRDAMDAAMDGFAAVDAALATEYGVTDDGA